MMTKWGIEILSPTSAYFPNTSWLLGNDDNNNNTAGNWTAEENKFFENALAYFDKDTPDRWAKLAEMIPGKTVEDVKNHYQDLEHDVSHIEAGLIPIPGYSSSSFILDWESSSGFDGFKQAYGGKRGARGRLSDQERKKGVPWTEEEHRLFLQGLKKYGKGDWRNISRNCVKSRDPTQVASHAQKFFIRLNSGSKDKRRSSIHDITTVDLHDSQPSSPPHPSMQSTSTVTQAAADSGTSDEATKVFSSASSQMHGNPFSGPSYFSSAYHMKFQAQNSLRGGTHHESAQHMFFQMHPTQLHPNA